MRPLITKSTALILFAACLLAGAIWVPFASAEKLWTEKSGAAGLSGNAGIVGSTIFRDLAEKMGPGVVNIRIMQKVQPSPFNPWGQPPGFNQPPPDKDGYRQRGEGSGFIIHEDGYILTNAHVAADSDQLQVALPSGKLYKGRLVGFDRVTDIGLVKIEATEALPVLPLGDSDAMKPGDWVMAIGSPFGLEQTVTVGVVSGKGRSLGASPYDDFIQTDASINPGNSGGPLINVRGEVVAINTAILAQGQGLGFSVPINLVKKLTPQLKEKGRVVRSWLGVNVQDVTLALKEKEGLRVDSGSYIERVTADSPAHKAGIQKGDVIVQFQDALIKNSRELPTRVAHTLPGTVASMTLMRGEKRMTVEVTLEAMPGQN